MTELNEVLHALMSPDNQLRNHAEQYYSDRLEKDFMGTVGDLLAYFSTTEFPAVARSLCGILLRRCLSDDTRFSPSSDYGNQMKSQLLALWIVETDVAILRRLSHIMAQLASNSSNDGSDWEYLISSILSAVSTAHQSKLLATMGFIEIACDYCGEAIAKQALMLADFLSRFLSGEFAIALFL